MITIWAPDDAARSAISSVIKVALDSQPNLAGEFSFELTLPDGSQGIIRYVRTYMFDTGQVANVYRRDLIYQVEYPTILQQTFPPMLFGQVNVQTTSGEVATFGTEPPNFILTDENGNVITTGGGQIMTSEDGASNPGFVFNS